MKREEFESLIVSHNPHDHAEKAASCLECILIEGYQIQEEIDATGYPWRDY